MRAKPRRSGRKPKASIEEAPHWLPFVGREAELAALRPAMTRARDGGGSVLFVTGDSGVGKTRFLQQLAAEGQDMGFTHAAGSAWQAESGWPYAIFADALAAAVQALDASALRTLARGMESELSHIVPALATARQARESALSATHLFWHFKEFLRRLAERKPLFLTLDNLHWADDASLQLLHFIGRQLTDCRILIAATWPADAHATRSVDWIPNTMSRDRKTLPLRLGPLSVNDVTGIVSRKFGATGSHVAHFAARLQAHTGGNAFFVEEVLRALVQRRHLRTVEGGTVGWETDVALVPGALSEWVRARLATLPDDARTLADEMSVIGLRVPVSLVQRLRATPAAAFDRPLGELLRLGVINQVHGALPPVYYFTHPIVREFLHNELAPGQREALHGSVIQVFEATYGEKIDHHAGDLVPHLLHAGDSVTARHRVRYFLAAGRFAQQSHAHRDAVRLLTVALDSIDGQGKPEAHLSSTLLLLALANNGLGHYAESKQLILRAIGLARQSGDANAEAELERQMGVAEVSAGEPRTAIVHFAAAAARARTCGNTPLAVQSLVNQATTLQSLGQPEAGRELLERIVPIVEALGDPVVSADLHRAMAELYCLTGPLASARRHAEMARLNAELCGNKRVLLSVHWAHVALNGMGGDTDGLRRHQKIARQLAIELHATDQLIATAELGIECASIVGRWQEGIDEAASVLPAARVLSPRILYPRLLVWTGLILLEQDKASEALERFSEAWQLARVEETAEGRVNVLTAITACIGMATWHLRENPYADDALTFAERGLELADRFGLQTFAIHRLLPILCEAAIWRKRFDRAAAVSRRLRDQSRALGHPLGEAIADAADALLRRFRDDDPHAWVNLLAAADRLEELHFLFMASRLRLNAAQRLIDSERPAEATALLLRAYTVFAALRAERELRVASDQMRRIPGLRRPTAAATAAGGILTPRQREVADLLGLSDKAIAQKLNVEVRTVTTHVTSILEKLQVKSREDVARALREGRDVIRANASERGQDRSAKKRA